MMKMNIILIVIIINIMMRLIVFKLISVMFYNLIFIDIDYAFLWSDLFIKCFQY